jgi:DNA invertase Pin-like site-specific DNA recombinase
MYRALQFVYEEILSDRKRCVFVNQGIDTAQSEHWKLVLQAVTIQDEMQTTLYNGNIRAAHIGQLQQGMVFGSLPYGYRGEPIPDTITTKGKAKKQIIVDDEQAEWVRTVFRWFTEDRKTIPQIVSDLNRLCIPAPKRSRTGRWTRLIVKKMLENERYRGRWRYGETEACWMDKQDYSRQLPRDNPLETVVFEELRIIDDASWYEAQHLMEHDPHRSGRRPSRPAKEHPKIVNGILFCGYCQRPLVTAASGGQMICPACKETGGQLYSHLKRDWATTVVCTKLAELIRSDVALAERIVTYCQNAADDLQRPDSNRIEELQKRLTQLANKIEFVYDNPGETEADQKQSREKLKKLQTERNKAHAEMEKQKALAGQDISVPTREEVQAKLNELDRLLLAAAEQPNNETAGKVRRLVELMTRGRIELYQAGDGIAH